jgi:iron(III) transport system ATP-binding protein
MSSLQLKALSKRYGAVLALDNIDLTVTGATRTAIVGPSGSGKTTLLRLIAGFDAPDSGSVMLDEQTLANGNAALAAHLRSVGVIAQDGALFPHLNIGENIGFGIGRHEADRDRRIAALAEIVGLEQAMLKRRPDQISGGQQQRVAIARALARKPKLMLLDEPFSALDTSLRGAMRHAVSQILGDAGVTTILVTHDQAEALSFGHQLAVMGNGALVQTGTPQELYLSPRNRMVADFLGDAIILPAEIRQGFAQTALGLLSVDSSTADGEASVMLRPEQLSIELASDQASPSALGYDILGQVTAVDFAGALCTVTIELMKPTTADGHRDCPPPQRLSMRVSAYDLPERGAVVRLSARGKAHVFGS